MITVLVAAGAAAVLGFLLIGLGRRHRYDDVERFHRASRMTSAWARGVTTPVMTTPEPQEDNDHAAGR